MKTPRILAVGLRARPAAAWLLPALALTTLLLAPLAARAGDVVPAIIWRDAKPVLQFTLTNSFALPDDTKEVRLPVTVTGPAVAPATGTVVIWQGEVVVPVKVPQPWHGEQVLDKWAAAGKECRAEIALTGQYNIYHRETLTFTSEQAPVRSYGLRRTGVYPEEKVALVLSFNGMTKELTDIPCTYTLRDHAETLVASKEVRLAPGKLPVTHVLDVTPDTTASVGPYTLEFSLENEALGVFTSTSLKFGFANALVPVTSFERADPSLWFLATGEHLNPLGWQSGNYYYSPQMTKMEPSSYPGMSFATDSPHSGLQALKIDYKEGLQAVLWSRQELPGNPTVLAVWVKGNDTDDVLKVTFNDHINHTLQAWIRNSAFSTETICKLDFEGWRRFRVPVLGNGLSVPSKKGSTENIDGPISLLAFTVVPGGKKSKTGGESHTLYLDDLQVETQADPGERLNLELQSENADGELRATSHLSIALSNGANEPLAPALVTLVARDAAGQTLLTEQREATVTPAGIAMLDVPLGALAAKQPVGPIDLDVTATVAKQAALRTTARLTLKSPQQAGVVQDFEEAEPFNGFVPGKILAPVGLSYAPGAGVDGSTALAMAIDPTHDIYNPNPEAPVKGKPPPPPAPQDPTHFNNSVVFHPALPGIVAGMEMMIKGSGVPVTVQPWFADVGYSGIWLLPYNVFWPTPITVDWEGWRKVTIAAPAIPPWYAAKERYFYRQPGYPLNFALGVRGATPTAILFDNLRVITHLPADKQVQATVVFPDQTRLLVPGAPLTVRLTNFAATPAALDLAWTLTSAQGQVTASGKRHLELAPGSRTRPALVEQVPAGVYYFELTGAGATPLNRYLIVRDAKAAFGEQPQETVSKLPELRRSLHLLTERLYLDWDNSEPVPGLFHFTWVRDVAKKQSIDGAYQLLPIFGFSSDWAGPEAQEKQRDGSYLRTFPNYLQIPAHTLDWSLFVREAMREHGATYNQFVFWENPDLDDAPQGIPPARYRELLHEVYHWVKAYRPDAQVIAGGFNYQKVLDYLDKVQNPDTLDFDAIAVQMNFGELSPEAAELEAFLDDLGARLKIKEKNRSIRASELDWSIGPFVTPLQQAAYHVRASLILASRGVPPHQFAIMNGGFSFESFGAVYRESYGSTDELQTFKPFHIPKPAYFALRRTQDFLAGHQFVAAVQLPHLDLGACRAFLYQDATGRLTAATWSATSDSHPYQLPAAWKGVTATDAFGVPMVETSTIHCDPLPVFYELPAGYAKEQALADLRHLPAVDGSAPVLLDLRLAEEGARQRAGYQSTGTLTTVDHAGRVPGGAKLRESFLTGMTKESFNFTVPAAGDVLLIRRWYFADKGVTLTLQLDDQPPTTWALTAGQDASAGIRESTYLLRGCTPGTHRLTLTSDVPGNCAGYRLEPLATPGQVPLARWGILHGRQSVGEVVRYHSAVGTPLRIGKQDYASGIGAHATSFIEYPLAGQFSKFSVTVGLDGYTEGRGSVVFKLFVDGKEVANSGLLNGLSKPLVLSTDKLAGAQRLILSVTDGADGTDHDVADWVDGTLVAP